jgi:hypothetical protein
LTIRHLVNQNNFSYEGDVADLGDGVSVQGWNFDRLQETFSWDEVVEPL